MVCSYLLIVTGASRGFGKALCVAFAETLLCSLDCVLVGRSASALEETAREIESCRPGKSTKCEVIVADLASGDGLEDVASRILDRSFSYSKIVYINNAGTLLPVQPVGSELDIDCFSKTIQLNVTSPCILVSEFLRRIKASETAARVILVNVSSLWAVEPASSFGAYCATKAAVEMYFEVIAGELSGSSNVRVLNYAPGPLDTAMQEIIRSSSDVDSGIQSMCRGMHEKGQLVSPYTSALKCVRIVVEELFKTGDHVDFYDQVEGVDYPRKEPTTCCANPDCQCGPGCMCGPQEGPQCGACSSFMLGNRT
mmetsp:Transcript_6105/g.9212  ORF Transcript_6105/g.9212 Transcript_6105/m.9212 type:complete len:311 (+) Transcript_6105:60-992(+)